MKNPMESIYDKIDETIGNFVENQEQRRREHERQLRSDGSAVIDLSRAISMPGKNVTSVYAHLLKLADRPEIIKRAIERADIVIENGHAHEILASQGADDDGTINGVPALPAQNAADPIYRYSSNSYYWRKPVSSED